MKFLKLTPEQQLDLCPMADIREAFMQREDIRSLSEEERESKWQERKLGIYKLMDLFSTLPSLVPDDYDPERP